MALASVDAVIVLQSFGPYTKGQLITDPEIIGAILNGGNASMVIKTQIFKPGSIPAVEEH